MLRRLAQDLQISRLPYRRRNCGRGHITIIILAISVIITSIIRGIIWATPDRKHPFFRDPSLTITIITIATSCKKLLKFTEVYLFFFSNSVQKAGGLTTLTTLTSTIQPSSKSKLWQISSRWAPDGLALAVATFFCQPPSCQSMIKVSRYLALISS